jgi:signal transduction histidine kinase
MVAHRFLNAFFGMRRIIHDGHKIPIESHSSTYMISKPISIRYLLAFAFVLASLIPVSVFSGMAFFQARQALELEISEDIKIRSKGVMEEIDRMMFERQQNLNSWSGLDIMRELRIGDVDKRLSDFLSKSKTSYRGLYLEIHAVNLNNKIIASSEAIKIGLDFTEHQNPSPLKLSTWLFLSPIIDPITNQLTGYLYAIFDWSKITNILERSTGDSREAALFDSQGNIIGQSKNWQQGIDNDSIQAISRSKGYQGAPSLNWSLVVLQSKNVAFTPIRELGWMFLLFLFALIAISILAAAPVATMIAKPLRNLSAFTRNFKKLPNAGEIPKGGPKEIQALSKAFEHMIQDLHQSQQDLTRAAKLAVVGELSSALSHEVRTPLGILKSSAQILMREQGLSKEGREVCGFILSETDRMNKLIDTLLDSAKVRPIEIELIDLVDLIQQTITMLSVQQQKSGVKIDLIGPKKLLVDCDKEQITQVLLNLMINALQLINRKGKIEVNLYSKKNDVLIEIADTGPGIPIEFHERVFDPFFSKRPGGIGLGLAVVRKIIEAHQGTISAKNSHLGGALFTIRLPIKTSLSTQANKHE